MNTIQITRTYRLGIVAGLVFLLPPCAGAVNVIATIATGGPINVNDTFVVELSVTGWNAADGEIDSIAFFVDWDITQFAFVTHNPLFDSTEFLAESNQGVGYAYSDDTDTSLTGFGRYIFGASDSGDATAGSIGGSDGSGALGTITLRALSIGTYRVMPGSNDDDSVFGDTSFAGISPTGGVTYAGDSIRVIPEPASGALVVLAGAVVLAHRRRKTAQ